MRQFLCPACLAAVIYFRLGEPEEVFVVCDDLDLLARALQEVAPGGEAVDDGQHFLVVDLIVLFREVELSAVEGDWV